MVTGRIDAAGLSLRGRMLPWAVVVTTFAFSVGLRAALSPVLGLTVPYITFYPAILLSAWYGGMGPGVFTTGLCGLYALYFLIPPTGSFYVRSWADGSALLLFLAIGCFMSWVIQAFHSSRRIAQERLEKLAAEQRGAERSRLRIQHVLESIADGFVSVDRNCRLTYVNAAAERITGAQASQPLGDTLWQRYPQLLGTELERHCRRVAEERVAENFEMLTENRGCWTEVNLYPAQDGGLSISLRDISERKRADAAMARLAAIVESSDDAILSQSLDGIIETWNAGAERLYGYSAAEARGRPASFLAPEDRLSERAEILARSRNGEGTRHFETVRVRKNGGRIDISLSVSPLRDEAGNIVGLSHIARDIGERRRIEKQSREIERLESLSALAAGVAHDFNNLLVGVVGNASLALDLVAPTHPVRAIIENLLAAGERAAGLSAQMLAYSGHGRFVVQSVDLSAVVREIAGPLQASLPPGVRIQFEAAGDAIRVEVDVGQLRQLLASLVANAAEAIPPGHTGVVRIATARRPVDSQEIHPAFGGAELDCGAYGCVEVEDPGCGMDEQTQAKIFDPFFTTKFPGRGLGLAAVFGIVRGHKGIIGVSSAPGRGTTIRIFLPISRMDAARSATILVADEDAAVRQTAKRALEHCGYRVITAESGQAASNILQSPADEIALVVLDPATPGMRGELANLRARVVLASALSQADALRRFDGTGPAGFLQKPYTAPLLVEMVDKILYSGLGKAMHG